MYHAEKYKCAENSSTAYTLYIGTAEYWLLWFLHILRISPKMINYYLWLNLISHGAAALVSQPPSVLLSALSLCFPLPLFSNFPASKCQYCFTLLLPSWCSKTCTERENSRTHTVQKLHGNVVLWWWRHWGWRSWQGSTKISPIIESAETGGAHSKSTRKTPVIGPLFTIITGGPL